MDVESFSFDFLFTVFLLCLFVFHCFFNVVFSFFFSGFSLEKCDFH